MRAGCAARDARAASTGPTIVCAQAGNVNTGAFDPLDEIADAAARARARGSTSTARSGCGRRRARALRHLVAGAERADSWATDAHKWLNVPYDCGIAFVAAPRGAPGRDERARRLPDPRRPGRTARPDGLECPSSRGARAASRSTRRSARSAATGIAELVERCCAHARRFADAARGRAGRRGPERRRAQPGAGPLRRRRRRDRARWSSAVQDEGTCWLGGTTWHGVGAMRISVSNWSTSEEDVERSIAAILEAAASS